jgi:uncharacterized membrane protein
LDDAWRRLQLLGFFLDFLLDWWISLDFLFTFLLLLVSIYLFRHDFFHNRLFHFLLPLFHLLFFAFFFMLLAFHFFCERAIIAILVGCYFVPFCDLGTSGAGYAFLAE